jgi:hypothetical protein
MAQYEAAFSIIDTKTGTKLRTETFNFYANNVIQSIKRATTRLESRNAYFERVADSRYVLHLHNLKLFTPGYIGNPKYDPAVDLCDDCYRPFWKGHNPTIEH